ncbi:DoxX family protein [Chamaesiphon minutus]|uniref:Putative membrane protein n=1 Tax=Chamaesiphon minutus (strain ATCC 27169 / PCC 6605) TaxID=1173020 RepID=K9UE47_CHAP6|nr:DoxX family protein [Chamaesiphon minutus]AFY92701.1 putative membrane protein [Chamaesiphon minutus PCC 6605]
MQVNSTEISLKPRDLAIAHLLLRVMVGGIFFNSGFNKIFNIPAFVERMVKTLDASYLPDILIRLGAYPVPIIELVVGVLIILGLSTRIALILTFTLMVMFTFGAMSAQLPELVSSQLIYGIVLFLLLATCRYNWFSLDSWLHRKQRRTDSVVGEACRR